MPTIEKACSWYPDRDPVHGFEHVLRVYHLSEKLAIEEGADLEIVRAAALLHDARIDLGSENCSDIEQRSNHHLHSADLAAQTLADENWPQERIAAVRHCILAHRFRDPSTQPQTLEARILFDADKLDAIGAIGVARAIAYAVQAGQPFFAQPSPGFLESGRLQAGEPHSAFHEYIFKLVKLKDCLYTPSARKIAELRQLRMVSFFEDLSHESTGIDYPSLQK
jgi:uncharacterized protein